MGKYTIEELLAHFPLKDKIRPTQRTALEHVTDFLNDPVKKFFILEGPTGFGKSAFGVTCANAVKSAYIVTTNKMLQDQYIKHLPEHLVDFRGRGNYKCYYNKAFTKLEDEHIEAIIDLVDISEEDYKKGIRPDVGAALEILDDLNEGEEDGTDFLPPNCASGNCRTSKDKRKICAAVKGCEYHSMRAIAGSSKTVSMNSAAIIYNLMYNKKFFQERELLVIDEAHRLESQLTDSVEVTLSNAELVEFDLLPAGFDMPVHDDVRKYMEILKMLATECDVTLGFDELSPRSVAKIESIQKKIETLISAIEAGQHENWIVVKSEDCLSFKPIVLSGYAESRLFKYADKVILMSATLGGLETFTSILGIEKDNYVYYAAPMMFPPKNRPIKFSKNIPPLNSKNIKEHLPEICKSISTIMNLHKEDKGIIHGSSYSLCQSINAGVQNERILFPNNSFDKARILESHQTSDLPTVLLSPSMGEGVDLYDDLCRFTIIPKLLYPDVSNPVLKRRAKLFPKYIENIVALNTVQAYGRGIRHENDFAVTYLLDRGFKWFIPRNKECFPGWFLEAINWSK